MDRRSLIIWMRQVFFWRLLSITEPFFYVLAYLWRRILFRTTFVGITGSVGKTTCKEALSLILSRKYSVFKSVRNQNGSKLVTLNVLRVRPWHQLAVFELATNSPGGLRRSGKLIRPDIVIITDIARTHTRGYTDIQETAVEKLSLLADLKPRGLGILNGNNDYLSDPPVRKGITYLWYGTDPKRDLVLSKIRSVWPERLQFQVEHSGESHTITTQLVGEHWAFPLAAAILAARELDCPMNVCIDALDGLQPYPARLQPVTVSPGITFLRDEYNASYCTFEAAFAALRNAKAGRRIAVLADCIDSDPRPKRRLALLGTDAAGCCDLAVFLEPHARHARSGAIRAGMDPGSIITAEDLSDALSILQKELRPGDLVLLKGQTRFHLSRLLFSLLGTLGCWKSNCPKTILCEECWELGAPPGTLVRVDTLGNSPKNAASSNWMSQDLSSHAE